MDIGLGDVVELPDEETRRRSEGTTPQWPIMHGRLGSITRDQMMARHRANHIQVAYAPNRKQARKAAQAKAKLAATLGIAVNWCGDE